MWHRRHGDQLVRHGNILTNDKLRSELGQWQRKCKLGEDEVYNKKRFCRSANGHFLIKIHRASWVLKAYFILQATLHGIQQIIRNKEQKERAELITDSQLSFTILRFLLCFSQDIIVCYKDRLSNDAFQFPSVRLPSRWNHLKFLKGSLLK